MERRSQRTGAELPRPCPLPDPDRMHAELRWALPRADLRACRVAVQRGLAHRLVGAWPRLRLARPRLLSTEHFVETRPRFLQRTARSGLRRPARDAGLAALRSAGRLVPHPARPAAGSVRG